MMTNKQARELLKAAIQAQNIEAIGRCVDFYRYWMGKNYDSIYAIAKDLTGISSADWDGLLYYVDVAENE